MIKNKNISLNESIWGIENSIILTYLIFLFSFNFHSLWLVYDLLILFFISQQLFAKKKQRYLTMNTLLVCTLLFFFYSVSLHGYFMISFLSFWDTFKNLFFLLGAFKILKRISNIRRQVFFDRLFNVSIVSFFIQVVFIFYQKFTGVHFDNISGTLGDGSSHAIGYFSLLIVIWVVLKNSKPILVGLVLILSLIINVYAENIGFFVLVVFTMAYLFISKSKNLVFASAFLILAFPLINIFIETEDLSAVVKRVSDFTLLEKYTPSKGVRSERNALLGYAFSQGEMTGQGFGSYSQIYSQEGWKYKKLINGQINISEISHLVAEAGVIGCSLTLLLFIALIRQTVKLIKLKWFAILLFILGMLYNRFLMDERIFFLFTMILIIFYAYSTKSNSSFRKVIPVKDDINSHSRF